MEQAYVAGDAVSEGSSVYASVGRLLCDHHLALQRRHTGVAAIRLDEVQAQQTQFQANSSTYGDHTAGDVIVLPGDNLSHTWGPARNHLIFNHANHTVWGARGKT